MIDQILKDAQVNGPQRLQKTFGFAVSEEEFETFKEYCKINTTTPSRLLREFVRTTLRTK